MIAPHTLIQHRYLVQQRIGQGGMGAVYEAIDQRLGCTVALKHMTITGVPAQQAFEREARLLAGLRHAALPKVMDHFADPAGHFLVMEFIPGPDLLDLLQQRGQPFALNDVLQWADQLLEVLDYLHGEQIIHRDIKPQNLKLTSRGQVVLLDFGLAKHISSGSMRAFTPHYAPVEQMLGRGTDPRSDLYSLAATFYHLLTGNMPEDSFTRWSARDAGQSDPLPAPHTLNPAIPPTVSSMLLQALALAPEQRPASAAAMRQALRLAGPATTANAAPPTIPLVVSKTITLYNVAQVQEVKQFRSHFLHRWLLPGHDAVFSVAFAPNGQTLAAGWENGSIKLWRVADGTLLRTLRRHKKVVWGLDFTCDGRILASASEDHTIKLWHTADGRLQRTLTGHTTPVWSVALAPDGQLLASASVDTTVKLWRTADGTLLRTLTAHKSRVYSVAFAPDGQTLASASDDHTLKLWRVADGALLCVLIGHLDAVTGVAFAPDGQTLASAAEDCTIRLWCVADGRLLRVLTGHSDPIYSLAFAPDGQLLASASQDWTIKLWGVGNGRLLRSLTGHKATVASIAFAPDGRTLASASGDGTIRLWGVGP